MSDVLEDIRREIAAGAVRLEGALVALGASPVSLGARRPTRGRSNGGRRSRRARRSAPHEQTKGQIPQHLGAHPGSTAGDIARAFELNRNSVATRLAQMAKSGEIDTAKRGYAVAG